LGRSYASGARVKQDYAEAARWFLLGANNGDVGAQFHLGVLYADGTGVPQDDSKAGEWYRKAADQGMASAQFNLGLLFDDGIWFGLLFNEEGKSVQQDSVEAARLYRAAADQGMAEAQINLGLLYADGKGGVPRDDAEASALFRKAVEQEFAQGYVLRSVPGGQDEAAHVQAQDGAPPCYKAPRLCCWDPCQGVAEVQVNLGRLFADGKGEKQDTDGARPCIKEAATEGCCPQLVRYKKELKRCHDADERVERWLRAHERHARKLRERTYDPARV
jgi:TPR repeat protein